jgi:hypothetical protein
MHAPIPIPRVASFRVAVPRSPFFAQTPAQYLEQAKAIQNDDERESGLGIIDKDREHILREWIAITEINAPSLHEQVRAKYIEGLLRKYKLQNIRYDAAGNLIAVRKGTGGGPSRRFRRPSRYSFSTRAQNQSYCSGRQSLCTGSRRRHAQH